MPSDTVDGPHSDFWKGLLVGLGLSLAFWTVFVLTLLVVT